MSESLLARVAIKQAARGRCLGPLIGPVGTERMHRAKMPEQGVIPVQCFCSHGRGG